MDKIELLDFERQAATPGVLPFTVFSSDEVSRLSVGTTSKGNQEKYKTKDGKFYIKSRFIYQQRQWRDDYVEVIASQYANMCTLPLGVTVVKQGLCKLDNEYCSYSEAFDVDDQMFMPFSRAIAEQFNNLAELARSVSELHDWFSTLRDFYSKVIGQDQTDYLLTMILLDTIVLNEDRHLSNFGYLYNYIDCSFKPSALFDFGLGLFEHSTSYYTNMPLDRALKKVRLKPWSAKVDKVLDFLEFSHTSFITSMLPSEVDLKSFTFPSTLARDYFRWINERLGVKVVGM